MVLQLRRWRDRGFTDAVAELLALHAKCPLWTGGPKAALLGVFLESKDFAVVNETYNVVDLGWGAVPRRNQSAEAAEAERTAALQDKKVLHWSGRGKPWRSVSKPRYTAFWEP